MKLSIILIANAFIYTVSSACDSINGGHWSLVRHAYDGWHPATDQLKGTDEYGTYDNDPQSVSNWSLIYNDALYADDSTLFMFSNGNCSQYLITTYGAFAGVHDTDYTAHIIASHYNNDYDVIWHFDASEPQNIFISWLNYTSNNTYLYAEGDTALDRDRFQVDHTDLSVNVWIDVAEYIYSSNTMNWLDAKSYCESKGTTLATVNSIQEWELAQLKCREIVYETDDNTNYGCWMGLNDIDNEGYWEWVDDTAVDFGFNNKDPTSPTKGVSPWAMWQPQNGNGQHCIRLWDPTVDRPENVSKMEWDDTECTWADVSALCNKVPTNHPTVSPIFYPSFNPTFNPTFYPFKPTFDPSFYPTFDPTFDPSFDPSFHPTLKPTFEPTEPDVQYSTKSIFSADDVLDKPSRRSDTLSIFLVVIIAILVIALCIASLCFGYEYRSVKRETRKKDNEMITPPQVLRLTTTSHSQHRVETQNERPIRLLSENTANCMDNVEQQGEQPGAAVNGQQQETVSYKEKCEAMSEGHNANDSHSYDSMYDYDYIETENDAETAGNTAGNTGNINETVYQGRVGEYQDGDHVKPPPYLQNVVQLGIIQPNDENVTKKDEEKEDVILEEMLSDVLKKQIIDPNAIHQMNIHNAVNEKQNESDSDKSDDMYEK